MRPNVCVLACGGTIASTGGDDGAAPEKSGAELVEAVPELASIAEMTVREVASRPGFDMDEDTVVELGRAVRDSAADGAAGVIVTHGTDTMEESAYYLDLALDVDVPVVFTGAQRRSDEIGFDGYANLLSAVRAVTHERFREAGGVYLAFDDEIHAARDVTKTHTSSLGTFKSPGKGPVASVTREGLRFAREPGSRSVSLPSLETNADVAMVKTGLGVGAGQLERALDAGMDGIVVEGTGLGNVTTPLGNAVRDAIESGVPVVISSRCQAGHVGAVYGTEGGGHTLREHGVISAGDLQAHKARIKLMLALATTDDPQELREFFEE